jgi:hypothetical protein
MLNVILVALVVVAFALYAGIAWGVVRKYRVTGNVGFLILGAGVLVWPLLSQLLRVAGHIIIERIINGGAIGIFPFSPLTSGRVTLGEMLAISIYGYHAIQGALILLGIVLLGRGTNGAAATLSSIAEP